MIVNYDCRVEIIDVAITTVNCLRKVKRLKVCRKQAFVLKGSDLVQTTVSPSTVVVYILT